MQTQQGPNPLIPMILIGLIIYFLLIRPQKQEQNKLKQLRSLLKKNDHVVTVGGIHGTVVNVKEKSVIVRVDDNCKIEFDKESISSITNKQENKS